MDIPRSILSPCIQWETITLTLFRRLTMISAVQQVRKTEEDRMTESQAKTYLEELGLAKSYNAVLDYEGETRMNLQQAQQFAAEYLQKIMFETNGEGKVTAYLITNHDTGYLAYIAGEGLAFSAENPLETIKGYISEYAAVEDYILLLETEDGVFDLVVSNPLEHI